jgi:hypothetical protein
MKIIVAFLLFVYSISPAFATFDKYYSDEVSIGSIAIFLFGLLVLFLQL